MLLSISRVRFSTVFLTELAVNSDTGTEGRDAAILSATQLRHIAIPSIICNTPVFAQLSHTASFPCLFLGNLHRSQVSMSINDGLNGWSSLTFFLSVLLPYSPFVHFLGQCARMAHTAMQVLCHTTYGGLTVCQIPYSVLTISK